MVDFKSLGGGKGSGSETDPRKIFQHIIKPDGVNELYASQAEVLDLWYSQRAQRDNIIKLPTGGGKSITGLLLAQSSLNELKSPVLYVTPNNQLNEQIEDEAKRFGLRAARYEGAKAGIPAEFLNAEAIGIASYNSVFNGLSKFGTIDRPGEVGALGAIIFDDAHAAFESVWDSFSFDITAERHKDLYHEIGAIFRNSFRQLNRVHTFDDVIAGKEYFVLDVPYWAWLEKTDQVAAAINSFDPNNVDPWSWVHLRDELHICQCLISKRSISIVPLLPSVDRSLAFSRSSRRIYMSATIADDSELIRTFGVAIKHIEKPITAASLAGVGERMILAPALIPNSPGSKPDILIDSLIHSVRASGKNTAILTPSFHSANSWQGKASVPKNGDETVSLIDSLKKQKGVAAVLPRRYDGVDLPGETCRLLIMDGLPFGSSNYDEWRINTLAYGSSSSTLAQRIEQAIGRGSRGTSDHCVVVLSGSDLTTWVGRAENHKYLSAATEKQLKMGLEVSRAVESSTDFNETAWKCLNRDPDWRAYHADQLGQAALAVTTDSTRLSVFHHERSGIDSLRTRQFSGALSEFELAIDVADDAALKGWFHQLKARTYFAQGESAKSESSQVKAYNLNRNLTAPLGQVAVETMLPPADQGLAVVAQIEGFLHSGIALASFEDTVSMLVAISSANQFEQSLMKLFQWLGLGATRPDKDYKEGPDVLVLGPDGTALVIEAKSRRKSQGRLTKTMHNQVLAHEEWYKNNYIGAGPPARIIIHPNKIAESNAGAQTTFAMTFPDIGDLVQRAREMLSRVGKAVEGARGDVAAQAIIDLDLTPAQIISHLERFELSSN